MQVRTGLVLLCLCAMTACSGNAPLPAGDAAAGQRLFEQGTLEIQACATCHSVDGSTDLLGPTLQHIATTAATRVSGQSAESYLLASMKTPNAYLVDGYAADLMHPLKATDQQYADVLAYLLTLK